MSKMEQLREELHVHHSQEKKKKRKWPLLLLMLFLLLVLGCVFLLYNSMGNRADALIGGNLTQGEIAGLTTDELREYLQNSAADAQVTLQMNTRPIFESGSGEGDLLIQNPEYNAYDMEVVIHLGADATGPEVYNSGRIPPGYFIDKDKLATVLNPGEHTATAYLSFYEDDTFVTTASADMVLVIES